MRPGRHRKPRGTAGTIILLAALAAAMIAGTIAVACVERNREPEPPKRNPTTAEAEPSKGNQTTAEPEADPEQEQEQEPEPEAASFTWPTDITWERVAGIDLPVSPTDGPRNRNQGRATQFAQTKAGAVLAVLHLLVRTSYQVGPDIWEPTLRDQVVGPDASAYKDATRADQRTGTTDKIYAEFGGVRLDAYTPQAASMRVLIEAPSGTGAALVQVSWIDGDWRLVAPPGGDWSTVRTQAEAADYTPLPAR